MTKKSKKETDEETLQMFSLHQQGVDEETIAEKFGVHRTTVSRRLSSLKKQINKTAAVAIRGAESKGFELDVNKPIQGISIPTTNPFDILTDFESIARASVTAGTVPGSAVAYIISGFNDDGTKTVEERGTAVMKGFASLGGFIFGLVETSKSLTNEEQNRSKKMKLVRQEEED